MINIELTRKQLLFLYESLLSYTDEGPDGEGWPSPELNELRSLIERAVSRGRTMIEL